MKKMHVIGLLMIGIGLFVLMNAAKDASKYSSFSDAYALQGEKFKVNGILSKDKEMYYNPEVDPNYFSFYITDMNDEERKVVLKGAKPQDFERSEQIVLTGYMEGEAFIATDMLLKCPSKYKEEEIRIRAKS